MKQIEKEDNTLYESLLGKLTAFPEIRAILYDLLFTGRILPFNTKSAYMKDAAMFGFVRNEKENVVISNRIFENVLYNYFISEEVVNSKMFNIAVQEKNQFIVGGHLD
ncbi:MAG: hypothetical protein LIO99_00610 [Clostridiales bacterium]|nr:hypothetical protein [Clostridiales bacterium]